MKNFGFKYSISNGFRGVFRNKVMSAAAIFVLVGSMLVMGAFFCLHYNIEHNLKQMSRGDKVAVFIDPASTEQDKEQVRAELEAIKDEGIISGFEYVSKEEALSSERDRFKDYPALFETLEAGGNPYRDSFVLMCRDGVDSSELENRLYGITAKHIDEVGVEVGTRPVAKVTSRSDTAKTLERFKLGMRTILLGFTAVLTVISIFVIINTIRIALYTRRKEITILRYVGAAGGYINAPYVFEGMFIGLIAALLAFAAQWLIYRGAVKLIDEHFKMLSTLSFSSVAPVIAVSFAVTGLFCGVIGSLISLAKYMRKDKAHGYFDAE